MNTKVYASCLYQTAAKETDKKEKELLRLIKVKSEKLCNSMLREKYYTQLSYLTKEEQYGAVSVPKDVILDRLIDFLQRI